jgi:hypothetical protein
LDGGFVPTRDRNKGVPAVLMPSDKHSFAKNGYEEGVRHIIDFGEDLKK